MRPTLSKCLNCRRAIRHSDRRYLDAPARHGEPAMGIPDGACRFCAPSDDEEARDLNAYHERRISEARESW